ncbi:MAG: M48 family metallopeptidase [Rickettsiales bacterium]
MGKLSINKKQTTAVVIAVLLLALSIAAAIGIKYLGDFEGKKTTDENTSALPIPSPADLAATYGGLSSNATQQELVTRVGTHLAGSGDVAKLGRSFRFYLLADQARNNVFAMPDGSIFITNLLLNHLKTEGQVAALLAREMAHVTARHTPQYLVTGILTYSEKEERVADQLAVHTMAQAGYDPRTLNATLGMLGELNAKTPLEFFATHPGSDGRTDRIDDAIAQQFPNGVPDSLSK